MPEIYGITNATAFSFLLNPSSSSSSSLKSSNEFYLNKMIKNKNKIEEIFLVRVLVGGDGGDDVDSDGVGGEFLYK